MIEDFKRSFETLVLLIMLHIKRINREGYPALYLFVLLFLITFNVSSTAIEHSLSLNK